MAEKDIRTAIVEYLEKAYPLSTWKISYPNSPTGEPDIAGCIPRMFDNYSIMIGIYTAIEVKQPGEPLKKHQEYRIKQLKKAGAVAFDADSIAVVANYLTLYLPGSKFISS